MHGLAALTFAALAVLPGAASALAAPVPPAQRIPDGCTKVKPGTQLTAVPWAQMHLDFDSLWSTTEGRSIATGQPISVAVIDSGFDPRHPQLSGVDYTPTFDAVPAVNDGNSIDCVGHGTEVASIIAAQPSDTSPFHGVAPQVKIVPIKYTNGGSTDTAAPSVRAFKAAIDQHVNIINYSSADTPVSTPALVDQFKRAERDNILIVVAGGNDNNTDTTVTGNPTVYPAALSPQFPNMIAVSAIDQSGSTGNFSTTGNYIDVAAPGVGVDAAQRYSGFEAVTGTSFAAPFVTGTAALMLAAHPGMTAAEVKDRIEATADPPPAAVPDKLYGYGIVNPVLAVTGTQNDTVTLPPAPRGAALAAPVPPRATDRSLQHHALAIAIVLLGLAALVVTAAATLRGNRSGGRRTSRQTAAR